MEVSFGGEMTLLTDLRRQVVVGGSVTTVRKLQGVEEETFVFWFIGDVVVC